MTMPACFGEYWEGVAGAECITGGCSVLEECLRKFAGPGGALARWQEQVGAADKEELSKATGVSVEAISLALEYQRVVAPPVVAAPVEAPAPVAEPVPVAVPPPLPIPTVSEFMALTPLAIPPREVEAPEEAAASSAALARRQEEIAVTAKKKKGKAAATQAADEPKKGKPGRKPKASKTEAEIPTNLRPKKAGTVRRAVVPAKHQRACAKPAGARGSLVQKRGKVLKDRKPRALPGKRKQEEGRTWSDRYNVARWQRERERSQLIAELRPGMKLRREWQGERVEVVCLKHGYRYKGQVYPTLYSVVKEILGTVPRPKQRRMDGTIPGGSREIVNWSAPRFFRLPWIVGGKKGRT